MPVDIRPEKGTGGAPLFAPPDVPAS